MNTLFSVLVCNYCTQDVHTSSCSRGVFLRGALGGHIGPNRVLLGQEITPSRKGPEYCGYCKKGTFLDPIYDIQDFKWLVWGVSGNDHIPICSHL